MAQAATAAVPVRQYRFTADEFEQMGRAGILHEDQRLELIDGFILEMSPIGSKHVVAMACLNEILVLQWAGRLTVSVQSPIRLGPRNEPLPALAVLRHRPRHYANALPTPPDVLLVIEISDTSIEYDRDTKIPLYAKAGIPEAWLVDLQAETITVYREPAPEGYRQAQQYGRGEKVKSASVPGLEVEVNAVLS
jgi:hypothetical protein